MSQEALAVLDKAMPDVNYHEAITLSGVGKVYRIYDHPADRLKQSFMRGHKHYFTEHTALHPIDLTIGKGQTVGVIGSNGSGKSTLLQLITRTLTPTSGTIHVQGQVSALLELGAGFNPDYSGHDNIYLNGSIMGLSRAEIDAKYADIVTFSGLEPRMLQQAVSTYSSGMYVRLAFAVAIAVNPDILIVDEALAVGDEGFQRKCFARIRQLQEQGATILFVSHSARAIVDLCDHALLLDQGELLMQGSPSEVVASYHKMLFAPEEERATARSAITDKRLAPASAAAPETRTEYATNGGYIEGVKLCDADGHSVTLLMPDETYTLHYTLHLKRDVQHLRCSMMVKTLTGIELAGALQHVQSDASHIVSAGTQLDVSFQFRCVMEKGDYFINVGAVEEQSGQYQFIHRIVDALHIKVQPSTTSRTIEPTGFMDMGIEGEAICLT